MKGGLGSSSFSEVAHGLESSPKLLSKEKKNVFFQLKRTFLKTEGTRRLNHPRIVYTVKNLYELKMHLMVRGCHDLRTDSSNKTIFTNF